MKSILSVCTPEPSSSWISDWDWLPHCCDVTNHACKPASLKSITSVRTEDFKRRTLRVHPSAERHSNTPTWRWEDPPTWTKVFHQAGETTLLNWPPVFSDRLSLEIKLTWCHTIVFMLFYIVLQVFPWYATLRVFAASHMHIMQVRISHKKFWSKDSFSN